MDFFPQGEFRSLSNPGVTSVQLIAPNNVASAAVTITKVTVEPGARQPRHNHEHSEQTWIALAGAAELLLAGGMRKPIVEGDVARFAKGDIHGVVNTSGAPFVYMSVTAPPLDFAYAYSATREGVAREPVGGQR